MQFDYLYADLQVRVTFEAKGHSPFCTLTDRESLALQQLVYMTLNAFHFTRALYAADATELKEKKEQKDYHKFYKPEGGKTNDEVCSI